MKSQTYTIIMQTSDVDGDGLNNDLDGDVSFQKRLNENSEGEGGAGASFYARRNFRLNKTD
jgi:hypothetical protein